MVSCLGDKLKARARNQAAVGSTVGRCDNSVTRPPQHEGRPADPAQPTFELRVVHIGMPAVQAQRVPVFGVEDNFVIRHCIEVGGRLGRIVPAVPANDFRRGVEDIQDIRCFAIADFDPHSIYEDQSVNAVLTRDCDFRCQPATE